MKEEDEYIEYDGNNEINNHSLPLNNRGLSSSHMAVPKRLQQIKNGNTMVPKKNRGNNGVSTPPKKTSDEGSSLPLSEKLHNNKQKNRGLLSRFRKNKDEKEDNNKQPSNANNSDSEDDNGTDEVISKARKIKRIISIIAILAPVVFLLFFVLIIIIVVHSFIADPIAAVMGFGSGNAETISPSGTSAYQKETNYYNKLQSAQSSYQNRCGKQIGKEYLNASLMYYYYRADITATEMDVVIDYDRMSNMVDTIVNLMPCDINYNINGNFYNNLKNNSSFRSYYSDILKKESIDEILEGIFEIGKISTGEVDNPRSAFIPENTKIVAPSQVTSGITGNNNSTISNPSLPSTPNITQVSFKDYLLGIVYANVDSEYLDNNEKIKAYTVALATNVLAKNNLSLNTSTISLKEDYNTLYCNPDYGCSYVINKDVKSLQVGGGEGGNGNSIFLAGKYYYHTKMDDTVKKNVANIINDVYGKVMADKDDKYIEVDINKINKSTLTNYEDILKEAYSNLTIKNIRENVYDNGVNYGNVLVRTPVIFYDQWNYTNSFCSTSNIIRYAGCGITAMAIITSTYENSKAYDPLYMNNRMTNVYHNGYCAYNQGTYVGFFWKEAESMGYKILSVGKYSTTDKNLVTSHLRAGHLIIARMGPGLFTTGGHYIVLSGIDPDTKRVYVEDPYNYMNKIYHGPSSGSGWHSFNDIIIPQVRGDGAFYIIWKE